ncbi:MAG: PDZ domain-containing protein, partial [Gammaproteobacteria bacterium]|nr:PDZ domain-containing protein [Gammaproteobacteria bacterium]
AAAAGLRAGDVVLALNDAPIADLAAFSAALKAMSAGDRVRTRISREGAERTVEVNVAAR